MSLATRCSACGTAFRVVQDQLKVSGGWVRCGHCSEVFDALQGLFDLERESPPEWDEAAAENAPARAELSLGERDSAVAGADDVELDPRVTRAAANDRGAAQPSAAGLPLPPANGTPHDGDGDAAPRNPLGRAGPDDLRGVPPGRGQGAPGEQNGVAPGARADDGHGVRPDRARGAPPGGQGTPADARNAFDIGPLGPGVPVGLLRESAGDHLDAESMDSLRGEARSDAEIDAHLFGGRQGARRRAPAGQMQDRDRLDFSDARYDSDLPPDAAEPGDSGAADLVDAPEENAAPQPGFLRRAEQRARWERPSTRGALAAITVAAGLALALQVAHHFRDGLAARWPAARPPMAVWCELAGCTIAPPRRIQDISVESTALARAPDGVAFRLAVTLRSRAATPVAVPSLDLSLTDAGGRLVARKALAPRDLKPPVTTLLPGSEVVLQTLLAADDAGVQGYTVEIFYP